MKATSGPIAVLTKARVAIHSFKTETVGSLATFTAVFSTVRFAVGPAPFVHTWQNSRLMVMQNSRDQRFKKRRIRRFQGDWEMYINY